MVGKSKQALDEEGGLVTFYNAYAIDIITSSFASPFFMVIPTIRPIHLIVGQIAAPVPSKNIEFLLPLVSGHGIPISDGAL
jgi:hypothetical protein